MIVLFSTDTFSANHTGSLLLRLVHIFRPDVTLADLYVLHVFIRKGAHFSVYGFLSFLSFRSWRVTLPRRSPWTFTWSGLALLLTLAAASYDEFHQIFVPSRTASGYDVLLDMVGAVFVQTLIASFAPFNKKR